MAKWLKKAKSPILQRYTRKKNYIGLFTVPKKVCYWLLKPCVDHLDNILHLDKNTYNRCGLTFGQIALSTFFWSCSDIRQVNKDVDSLILHISLLLSFSLSHHFFSPPHLSFQSRDKSPCLTHAFIKFFSIKNSDRIYWVLHRHLVPPSPTKLLSENQ